MCKFKFLSVGLGAAEIVQFASVTDVGNEDEVKELIPDLLSSELGGNYTQADS